MVYTLRTKKYPKYLFGASSYHKQGTSVRAISTWKPGRTTKEEKEGGGGEEGEEIEGEEEKGGEEGKEGEEGEEEGEEGDEGEEEGKKLNDPNLQELLLKI